MRFFSCTTLGLVEPALSMDSPVVCRSLWSDRWITKDWIPTWLASSTQVAETGDQRGQHDRGGDG
ncbi:MAG: hypothetical protein OEV70_03950 [Nitrospirota bacterium]|nr:hypothetical protein [Nitrospirota bacterium]